MFGASVSPSIKRALCLLPFVPVADLAVYSTGYLSSADQEAFRSQRSLNSIPVSSYPRIDRSGNKGMITWMTSPRSHGVKQTGLDP